MKPPVDIHDTSLRDSIGDFVTYHLGSGELAEVLGLLDRVGFASIDSFGGSAFLPTMKVLGEDPWQRLRAIRKAVTRTPLQAVLRGRLVFGHRPVPLPTIRATLRQLWELGVDRVKISDPGLDIRGARSVVEMAKTQGFHVTGSVIVSWGQVDRARDILLEWAAEFASGGADSVGIQDPFGVLPPSKLSQVVTTYCRNFSLPLRLHMHDANLLAVASLHAGLRAGARGADTTISTLSWTYSPPQTESLAIALRDTPEDPRLDLSLLEEVSTWFERAKAKKGYRYNAVYGVDHRALRGEMPTAVRKELADELRERGQKDLLEAAWEEVPRVWQALGRPPLLTPLLQAVCGQAIENAGSGVAFVRLDGKAAAYLRGEFGPPLPGTRPDLVQRAREQPGSVGSEPIDFDELAAEAFECEDDRLTYALFPEIAHEFFGMRSSGGRQPIAPDLYLSSSVPSQAGGRPLVPRRLLIKQLGEAFEVTLEGMGPAESGKRTLFLRVGGEAARVDVEFPEPGAPPAYTLWHHGRAHKFEFVEVLPPTKRSLPVLLRKDGQLEEVLFSFPRPR